MQSFQQFQIWETFLQPPLRSPGWMKALLVADIDSVILHHQYQARLVHDLAMQAKLPQLESLSSDVHILLNAIEIILCKVATDFIPPGMSTVLLLVCICLISERLKQQAHNYKPKLCICQYKEWIKGNQQQFKLEIVDQWSTRIPPPHRRG